MTLRTITAVFPTSSTSYAYFVPDGDEPQVGDLILTSISLETINLNDDGTPRSTLKQVVNDARVARVTNVDLEPSPRANKFYLQLIPVQDLIDRRTRNAELVQKERIKKEARAALDKILREDTSIELYRKIAESNPRAKELLAILEG